MRIIAGQFRSRRLKSPRGLHLRPTSDRLRETLFNVLGPGIMSSLFLDLYAGTGAIGIEAISRGARHVVFIESHATAARLIRENLAELGVHSGAEVIEGPVIRGLKALAARRLAADFVFFDPPYAARGEYDEVLALLDRSALLAPEGIAIAEHMRKITLPECLQRLERNRVIEQGDTALSFYKRATAPQTGV